MSVFGRPSASRAATRVIKTTTLRDFGGGLNVADTDLNMSPRFARVSENIETTLDGSRAVRGPARHLATVNVEANVVNHTYFNGFVISVMDNGSIWKIDGAGNSEQMLLYPGLTKAWPAGVTYVSFTVQNSDLIIQNGRDKPLIVAGAASNSLYMKVSYLVDLGTLSNINTPIGKFVVSHGQYTIVSGIPDRPSVLSISARNTSGTFLNDPAPNDAVEIDVGARVAQRSAEIIGLLSHRDKLLVMFQGGILPMLLGVYSGSPEVHTPTDEGFITDYGGIAHRAMQSIGDEAFFADSTSVSVLRRTSLTNTVKPERASQLIDPLLIASMNSLTPQQMQQYVFAITDQRNKRYMLFVPTISAGGVITETVVYSYTYIPAIKRLAWARFRGWNFTSACRTSMQNLIFGIGNKFYYYDFTSTDALDYIGDDDINDGAGVPITFDWELPWADFGDHWAYKQIVAVALDTEGEGFFTLEAYVNNIRKDEDGNPSPAATMDFRGGDTTLYGGSGYGVDPFGTGRATTDERMFKYEVPFSIIKFRIKGTTRKSLKIATLSFAYQKGLISV